MEHEYLKEVLANYNIKALGMMLLRHNENLTFRIGKDYLVQIHEHVEGFHTEHIYEGLDRTEVYEAEIRFLEHLKKQGMIVREPIENCRGERITKLSNGTLVTVSKWVQGESLDKLELNDELCYQIGDLTARLHRDAKGFRTFPVISYDDQHCKHVKERLLALEGIGLNPMYSGIMQEACDIVGATLQKVQDEFLLLHADLSPSNILLTPKGFAAIDFSLFGLGHPMLDLAILFGNISGLASRQKIAEGYRAAGGRINYEVLDACYVLTILDCVAIHFEQWSKQEWFESRMNRWYMENFKPFVKRERLLADDFYLIHVKD